MGSFWNFKYGIFKDFWDFLGILRIYKFLELLARSFVNCFEDTSPALFESESFGCSVVLALHLFNCEIVVRGFCDKN